MIQRDSDDATTKAAAVGRRRSAALPRSSQQSRPADFPPPSPTRDAACAPCSGQISNDARETENVMVTIVHLITGLETGGAERMLSRLVRRTDRDRFRSVVVSITDAGTLGPSLGKAGVEVLSLEMRRGMPDPNGLLRLARILREL